MNRYEKADAEVEAVLPFEFSEVSNLTLNDARAIHVTLAPPNEQDGITCLGGILRFGEAIYRVDFCLDIDTSLWMVAIRDIDDMDYASPAKGRFKGEFPTHESRARNMYVACSIIHRCCFVFCARSKRRPLLSRIADSFARFIRNVFN